MIGSPTTIKAAPLPVLLRDLVMNQFLLARELGLDPPSILKTAEITRRVYAIDLSPTKDVTRTHQASVNCLDIEAVESRYMLSGGADATVYLYDLEEPLNTEKFMIRSLASVPRNVGHKYGVSGVSWYPFDTGLFITSSFDHTVKAWDTNTMQEACTFDLETKVYSHAISPIASHCLVAGVSANPRIRLCDLRTGAFTHSLPGHRGAVMAVRWSPRDEFTLASGGTDHTVRIWDIRRSTACLVSLDQHNTDADPLSPTNVAHGDAVTGLTFTPTGHHLLSTSHDERLRLWDAWTGRNTLVNYGPYIRNRFDQALAPVVVSGGGGLGSAAGATGCDPPLVFHPGDDHQILVFDMFRGKLLKRLRGAYGRVTCICWRPDKEELYSGSNDHEILVWSPVVSKADIDQTPVVCDISSAFRSLQRHGIQATHV
ncbi:hypothetical protein BC936DRAFT_148458 [Jimgerdemannia flammicorona]|uniref:Uncharacterized protein n=1 Tax=Jimgerdemannia flammicorona TaxID=994334 RepID=A0A433D305_9FUNG|nr:hypothetical protein BC936DRAFT_148458 [Jimgerdemannia flammicorona]